MMIMLLFNMHSSKADSSHLRAGCTQLTKWLTKWITIWLAVDVLLATLIFG